MDIKWLKKEKEHRKKRRDAYRIIRKRKRKRERATEGRDKGMQMKRLDR